MSTTKEVKVTQWIRVTVDETKFDGAFMREFRESFYPMHTLDEHIEHLAQLYARGIIDEFSNFIEGYGPPKDMGIEIANTGQSEEIETAP